MEVLLEKLLLTQPMLNEFLNTDGIPTVTGFKLKPIVRAVQQHAQDYGASNAEIAKRFGFVDEDGSELLPTKENKIAANAELKKLLAETVHLPFQMIKPSELGEAVIKPAILIDLDWLIADNE